MKKLLFIISAAFLFACSSSDSEKQSPDIDYSLAIDSARAIMQAIQLESNVPGMAITVSVNGDIVWSEGFGYADIDERITVDPAVTQFRIGSVSKPLTATALAILYEEGKVDLDAPVQTYVPEFPEKRYPITVRQVAGHIAGIRHYQGEEFLSDTFYPTVREGLTIFEHDTLLFEPGSRYRYSSYGWNLISAVIEGASGKDFLTYMDEAVFTPAGLDHTEPDYANRDMPNRTKFYMLDSGKVVDAPYVDNSYKWAGGGFISTSEDLVKWGNSLLSNELVSQQTLEEITATQYVQDTVATGYGIGWRNQLLGDTLQFIGHSGGSVGGITQFGMLPDQNIVIAIVSNSSSVRFGDSHERILRHFLEYSSGRLE